MQSQYAGSAGSRSCGSSRCSHSARARLGYQGGSRAPAEVPLSGQLPYSPKSYALGNINQLRLSRREHWCRKLLNKEVDGYKSLSGRLLFTKTCYDRWLDQSREGCGYITRQS